MESDFFYSPSTKLYVAREPLKVDARVVRSAAEQNFGIQWDEEGRINRITLPEGLLLLRKLGSCMLTVRDYWQVLQDAFILEDEDMVKQLQSGSYTEWLNTVFKRKEAAIFGGEVEKEGDDLIYKGMETEVNMPFGHPGWFNIHDIDLTEGLPKRVELNREGFSSSWKYWSFCDYNYTAAAVRGWVTSVGKPSLDLGIPIDAREPVLLLRECRHKLPQLPLEGLVLKAAEKIIADFDNLISGYQLDTFYSGRESLLKFIGNEGRLFQNHPETRIRKIREKITDILGMLRIMAEDRSDKETLTEVIRVSRQVSGVNPGVGSPNSFFEFIQNGEKKLKEAVANQTPILFTMGHKNPDTDTVISSLFEAYRNSLIDPEQVFPIIQSDIVPDEVRRLLGKKISSMIITSSNDTYRQAALSGQARWILVDHNKSEVQKFAVSIIDHHQPSEVALRQDISKTLEMSGSTTALITQKLLGIGFEIPPSLAKLLYGATLMDTENRSDFKMTAKDELIMGYLKEKAEVVNDRVFYNDLMSFLLSTDNAETLFNRDYKEDWAFMGFAVAKVKGFFDTRGNVLKERLLAELTQLARQNNLGKNLPLTLVKITDYLDDNETVNRERLLLVFNREPEQLFIASLQDLLTKIIHHTFGDTTSVTVTNEYIEYRGSGKQLSRKKTAPLIEVIVKAYNEYFYSPSIELFVKRDFLKDSPDALKAAEGLGFNLSFDEEGRVNNITYGEGMLLLRKMGFSCMSLNEYWKVLADAKDAVDLQMMGSLQAPGFVEFLHTVIENRERVINKPQIIRKKMFFEYEGEKIEIDYSYRGKETKANIPQGNPGLIHPGSINPETGFPTQVLPPDIYDNPELWRYWSPDAEVNVATRGYIFLLGKPALDLKVHLSEGFRCLGLRPCSKSVSFPQVSVIEDSKGIKVIVKSEGRSSQYEGSFFQEPEGCSNKEDGLV